MSCHDALVVEHYLQNGFLDPIKRAACGNITAEAAKYAFLFLGSAIKRFRVSPCFNGRFRSARVAGDC